MGHYIGQLETTTAAQRPPSFFIQATATNHGSFLNYGREAAAFLNWATASINLSLYWTTWNNNGRAAAAFFLTTTAAQRSPFYWAIGNFGRAAAAFLNWATGIKNGHYIGQLETTRAAQRPPSFFIQATAINNGSYLDWTIGNYGREAAAFLNW